MSRRVGAWVSGVAAGLAMMVAGCVAHPPPSPPPPPHSVATARPRPKAPDWFHQQLALARRARAAHVPHSDVAGAQSAYDRVMVTACKRVAEAGPDKYRARCAAYTKRVVKPLLVPDDSLSCGDEDDSFDSPAQIKECSD